MARRSWFTLVLVLVLLFVTSDCLRGPTTNVDVSSSTTIRTRGGSRFSPKVEETPETSSVPFSTQSRSSRRGRPVVTAPSGRASDTKTETTTLRSRRDRDRNNEVNRNAKVITEIPNSPRGRESSGSVGLRRHSSIRGQVAEYESDLARAATSDRRYLPEGKDRRERKFEQEAKLELPNEGPKIVSRRQRGRTSNEETTTMTSTTITPRSRPTGRARTKDSKESRKSSARRIFERSTEKLMDNEERSTPRALGRRITERSTRRHEQLSSNSDNANVKSIPPSVESTTLFASRRGSLETPEPVKYSQRGLSKHSVFTSGEFENFDPLREVKTESNSRKSASTLLPTAKLRSHGRRSEPTTNKPQNSDRSESSMKSPLKDKTEKRVPSEKLLRFKNRSATPKPQTPKLEINTSKPKVSVKIDKLRSLKGDIQPRGKTSGKIDKLRTSRREIISETTTQSFETTLAVTTPQSDLAESTSSFEASESVIASTQESPTASSISISSSSASGEGKENSNKRRQAPVVNAPNTSSSPPPPKEDYFNHGLGFRGRKSHSASSAGAPQGNPTNGNPGWTLKRRPHNYANGNPSGVTNPPVTTNEIPFSGPRRQQVASVVFKIDREITSDDNYPPEFKAKLAKLNRSDDNAPGGGSRVTADSMMTVIRHTRSVDQKVTDSAFPENDQFPETVSPFPVVTTPLGDPEEAIDGSKKRLPSVSISSKAREKLANARKLIKPEFKSEELIGSNEKATTTQNPSRTVSRTTTTTKSPSQSSNEVSRSARRFGTPKHTTTSSKASTSAPISKSHARTSKSVQRGNIRIVETTKISQVRGEKTSKNNDEFVQTTLPYASETITVKSWVLSQKGKNPSAERLSTTTRRSRSWKAAHIDSNFEEPTTKSSPSETVTHILKIPRSTKRPRHWNAAYIDKNWQDPSERSSESTENPKTKRPFTPSKLSKPASSENSRSSESSSTIERPLQPIKRREFRPRTATYRRHSEGAVNASSSTEGGSVAITPKVPVFHASVKSSNSSERSARQEPELSLAVSNATVSNDANSTGISLSNRGSSGSSGGTDSNIFNPAKATFLINSSASLLEQLRSTVAPLLSALGNRTPIFSASYSTVDPGNLTRVTPSGSPPRFSARYRGAELFVRKPSGLDSSGPTTPLTSTKDGPSPQISISSPGEPKVITFYQALESASITNEVEQTTDNVPRSQLDKVVQVVTNNDTSDPNVTTNANNDTTTTTIETSVVPVTTVDGLTNLDDTQAPETTTASDQPNTTKPLDMSTGFAETTEMTSQAMTSDSIASTSETTPITSQMPEVDVNTDVTTDVNTDVNTIESLISNSTTESNDEVNLTTDSTMTEPFQASAAVSTESTSEIDMISVTGEPMEILMKSLIDSMETTTADLDNSIVESSTVASTTEATMETSSSPVPMEIATEALPSTPEATTVISMETSPSSTSVESTTALSTAPESTTSSLEILAQLQESTTTNQVTDSEDGTTSLSTESSTMEIATTQLPESTTLPEINPTDNDINSPDIDEAFLNEMMKRLMSIFNIDSGSSQSRNFEAMMGKSDDPAQKIGGFLDNTDRDLTIEVETIGQMNNTVDNTTLEASTEPSDELQTTQASQTDNPTTSEASNIETVTPESTTLSPLPEITTLQITNVAETNQTEATTLSPITESSNPTTESSSDIPSSPNPTTTEQITTTQAPETTDTPTTTTSDLPPPTDNPNILAGLQDEMPATAQRTASDEQTPSPLPTTTNSPNPPTTLSSTIQSDSATIQPESSSSLMPDETSQAPVNASTMVPINETSSTSTGAPMTQYSGRFGASRITPAPRFSSSSSTLVPLRDYHVYGIYPNKTIVRKRPEDNLIDARNVDSPYVIFGIFPDGKLVRKYPNGTVIPDPPSNPVEVVFSLSTTTTASITNRPITSNLGNNSPNLLLNNRIMSLPIGVNGNRSQLNLGLSGNAITIDGDESNQNDVPTLLPDVGNVGNQSTSNQMSDIPLNLQMGSFNSTTEMGLLTTVGPPSSATPSGVNPQGGRIIQDRERDKASRTKEAGGQRSSVYIGQEKFINYWSDDSSNNNDSRVVSVKINSVTSAVNEAPATSTGPLPPLDIISKEEVTAPPGFPWKDPLDQIFGITTESPVIRASVASNTIDEQSPSRSPITVPPINRLTEVFTPMSNDAQLARDTSITTTTVAPSVSTTFSTTSTTTLAATTSTATTGPTTTTTTTTTAVPSTLPVTISSTTLPYTTASFSTVTTRPAPFGATFDDLAFLNSLLQADHNGNFISSSTPKTLTDIEKLLANRILSLALDNAGPTRSPKAIQPSNSAPNVLDTYSPIRSTSQPIIIDLLQSTKKVVPSTTSKPVTWKPKVIVTPSPTTSRATVSVTLPPIPTSSTLSSEKIGGTFSLTSTQTPWMFPTHPPTMKTTSTTTTTTTTPPPTTTTTTTTTTTPRPTTTTQRIITTRKPSPRPSPRPTTTQPPFRFGANLLQAIFGRNIFAPPTTQRPVAIRRPQPTVQITPKSTTTSTTARSTTTASTTTQSTTTASTTTQSTTTTTTTRPSTTYSPEDDAKFLIKLLNAANNENKPTKASVALSEDDESFLRSILNGQATVKTPSPGSGPPSDAALLAELLKAQGIGPVTPVNNIRDQLDFVAKGGSTTNSPRPTTRRVTTSRPRPPDWASSSTYPPPLFSNFNFGAERPRGQGGAEEPEGIRNQMLNAAIGATRVFSQFLGAAITGAAQQLQSIVRNGTRIVSEAVG